LSSPLWICSGSPKVTVQISGIGTISPFGMTRLRLLIQTGTRRTFGRAEARWNRPLLNGSRGIRLVARTLREEDERGAGIERGCHDLDRVAGSLVALAFYQHGVEDIATDEAGDG
jgi:hypothetical protein